MLSLIKKKNICRFVLGSILLTGLTACDPAQESVGEAFHIPEGLDSRTEIRFRQYAVQGRVLYRQHCANCHQEDGSGLGKLIPPLAGADFLEKHREDIACIIRWGLQGPIVVNGQEYNQPMPANPQLKDIEIAQIVTYIFNAWGNRGGFVPVRQAEEWLQDCEQAE
jgi:cytochrome c551